MTSKNNTFVNVTGRTGPSSGYKMLQINSKWPNYDQRWQMSQKKSSLCVSHGMYLNTAQKLTNFWLAKVVTTFKSSFSSWFMFAWFCNWSYWKKMQERVSRLQEWLNKTCLRLAYNCRKNFILWKMKSFFRGASKWEIDN